MTQSAVASIQRPDPETGTWQRCENADCPNNAPKNCKGKTPYWCNRCQEAMKIIEVYMCVNESCSRGARKGKKVREDENIDLTCEDCGESLVEDTTYRILPA